MIALAEDPTSAAVLAAAPCYPVPPSGQSPAIDAVRDIYARNIFPAMKVDWRTYPDNIGHKFSPGCFRCHEGRHENQLGEVISHECSICHSFLNPVEGSTNALGLRGSL